MKLGLDRLLKQLSLRGRVWFILGTILTIILSGGVGVFLMMNYITSGYQRTIDHYKKMEADFFNIRIQMLEMTRTEKDFFTSKDEIYVDLMAESFDAFDSAFNSMSELDQNVVSKDMLDTIKSSITNYKAAFEEVVKLTLEQVELLSQTIDSGKKLERKVKSLQGNGEATPEDLQEALLLSKIEAEGAIFLNTSDSSYLKLIKSDLRKIQVGSNASLAKAFAKNVEKVAESRASTNSKIESLQLHLMKGEEGILKGVELLNQEATKQSQEMAEVAQMINMGMGVGSIVIVLITGASFVLFNRLSASMADISNKIRLSSHDTFVSSETLKSASDKVSKAASEQASAIQETVATLNEITAMVNKSVDNAKSSTEKANLSHEIASEGRESVNNMRQSMKDIENSITNMMNQVDESNEQIENIVKIISEISTKTAVINDIVFQTKLLSFNASVEAARAGEHGKGFAVVAEEVGNLAQMSGNAAKEISELLGNSSDRVQQIVKRSKEEMGRLVQEGSQKVTVGVDIANRCDEILGEVVEHVSNVKELMVEISHASKEQAEGVNNISVAMNELDEATHSNSDMAHETSSCSNELAKQSQTLARAVELLDTEVFGLKAAKDHMEARIEGNDTEEDIQQSVIESNDNVHELHSSENQNSQKGSDKIAVGFSDIPSSDNPGFEDE